MQEGFLQWAGGSVRFFCLALAVFSVLLFQVGPAEAAAGSPHASRKAAGRSAGQERPVPQEAEALVRDFFAHGQAVLGDDSLSQSQKRAKFGALFRNSADVPAIADFCLGSYVSQPTPQQRQRYYGLFLDLVQDLFLLRLSPYKSAKFEVIGARYDDADASGDRARIEVSTVVHVRDDAPPVDVKWIIECPVGVDPSHQAESAGNPCKIADLRVKGISLAQEQRSSLTALLTSRDGDFQSFMSEFEARLQGRAQPS